MKNKLLLEGEVEAPIGNGQCKYGCVSYCEPDIDYYEYECELTGGTCVGDPCPMIAKYKVTKMEEL